MICEKAQRRGCSVCKWSFWSLSWFWCWDVIVATVYRHGYSINAAGLAWRVTDTVQPFVRLCVDISIQPATCSVCVVSPLSHPPLCLAVWAACKGLCVFAACILAWLRIWQAVALSKSSAMTQCLTHFHLNLNLNIDPYYCASWQAGSFFCM